MKEIAKINIFLFVFVFLTACLDEQTTEESIFEEDKSHNKTVIEFKQMIKASELFTLFSRENHTNPPLTVFAQYGDINSSWSVLSENADEQFNWLLDRNLARLEFLLGNFDPDDPLEKPVHADLLDLFNIIESSRDIEITKIEMEISISEIPEKLKNSPLVKNIYEISIEEHEKIDVEQKPKNRRKIEDYDKDAKHAPIGGTSTLYGDGILHKFWFDESSLKYYSSNKDRAYLNGNKAPAFEIDSMFKSEHYGNAVVRCGDDDPEEIGNLPSKYVDTELGDSKIWRVCTVGTHKTSELKTWYLYWTWRTLEEFKTEDNPTMVLNFQPGDRCSWCISTIYNLSPAYCTCALGATGSYSSPLNNDGETWWQWMVSYHFNDAPCVEVQWYRN